MTGRPCANNQRAHSFRKAVATAVKRARRKEEKLAQEFDDAKNVDQIRECGELIKANLCLIKRGMEEVELPDLFHPGQSRTVNLDPRLKPMDNARRYFKQAQKHERGQAQLAEQLQTCRDEIEGLSSVLSRLDEWIKEQEENNPDADIPPQTQEAIPDELIGQAAHFRVHVEGITPDSRAPLSKKTVLPKGVRMYTSCDGMKIYVGKNASDNDMLSFRIARGNDWWFHAAASAGSHVVVKGAGGNEQLPPQTLLDAAHLAVHFSKMKNAARADVTKAQAKQLRKIKGAPAGQVQVQNGSTMSVRMEPDRLERLLKGGE